MTTKQILLKRVSDLVTLADHTIAEAGSSSFTPLFKQFRSQGLTFVFDLYGTSHPYYSEFERGSQREGDTDVMNCKGILIGIKKDIDNDYFLSTVTGLVSAEIFTDYLDMAQHYLNQKHKDAAAVITGSTLESHLKKLAQKNKVPIDFTDAKGQLQHKMGNELNTDLYKAGIYNKIEMGVIESHIKIRNEAAHGNYQLVNPQQVENMLTGVRQFMARYPI